VFGKAMDTSMAYLFSPHCVQGVAKKVAL